MTRTNYRHSRKSPHGGLLGGLLVGRGPAIAVVATISVLCFALGFFVGKAATGGTVEIVSPSPSETPSTTTLPVPEADKAPPVTSSPETGGLDKGGEESAAVLEDALYSVQVGAFKSLKDAEILKRKLKKKGYTAFLYKIGGKDEKAPFKVRVGRAENRGKAYELAARLKSTQGISGFVVRLE